MQTLAWLRRNGFKPVPLRPRSKAAVSRDYATPSHVPPDDAAWRTHQYEVGCVLGPQQGGPVDVDLDCDEALFFAPRFFPNTSATFGRASKLRSHVLYRVGAAQFDKQAFIDPVDNATIIELRGDNGHQTVMPGSVHEGTGELITWSDVPFPEVTTIDPGLLWSAARKVALATLIARHVWKPGYHNEPCKHLSGLLYYLEWELEDAEALIQAVMDFSHDEDRSRIPTVRATFKRAAAGRKVTGAGALRKQIQDDRIVDKILEWAGSPSVNIVSEYNERYAVVSVEGKFRIADTDVPAGEPPVFYLKDDFVGLTATDYSDERTDQGKPITKSRLWLASPRRRQYRNVDFMPGAEDTQFLNLWTGWNVPPAETYKGGCDGWLDLVRNVICGGDDVLYTWLLHWLANILREPTEKSLTAPVIIGVEGAGKSLALAFFGEILGRGYTVVTNDEHIHGKFNRHLSTTLLLHSDEALYAGDKRHAGIVRSLITDRFRIHESKGIDSKQVRNFLRLVLTANPDSSAAAPAKPGDRRYTVIDMSERKLSQQLETRVLKEMSGDGPAQLHRYLLDMEYDPKIPRTNVKNEALIMLKAANMNPVDAWWYDALYEGCALPAYLAWAAQPAQEPWPATVAGPALYASLCIRMKERGQRGIPTETALSFQFNRFVGRVLARSRRYFDDPILDNVPPMARHLGDRMSAILNLPDLAECRKAFERYIGQPMPWPETEKEDEDDQIKSKNETSPKF